MADDPAIIDGDEELAGWLKDPANSGKVARTRLRASERVIARVTDGIYRQPSSAFRELISNAWDADARSVTILTDAPRFSRIYIRDDGAGIGDDTMARLLHNIGGSAKRSEDGRKLGVTSDDDLDRSPGGRPLIGKIGIGLFSVSQLARRFRIVTKVKGADHRLVAEVRLRTYSEDGSAELDDDGDDRSFTTGEVFLTREETPDTSAHGTDIIIEDVKPRVRDLLRDADRWREIDARDEALQRFDFDTVATMRVDEPRVHSGYIADYQPLGSGPAVLSRPAKLPWTPDVPADKRMAKLVDAVEAEFSRIERPALSSTLDAYLEMLWSLGLSVPVEYVDSHPFDLHQNGELRLFWISNEARGRAEELELEGSKRVRDAVREQVAGAPELEEGTDPVGGFKVLIDDVELRRPIRFTFRKTEKRGLDHAMLFVGKFDPNMERVSVAQRGGDLALEGYLFWNGRIIPKENNGVLVRIRGASGALFDESFFKYQVSEQTRLRQITSELFVQRGMDAALNIDRESFNYAHPHVQLVTLWLHRAIRQLTNRHKDESAKARDARFRDEAAAQRSAVTVRAEEVWRQRKGADPVPDVVIAADADQALHAREQGSVALLRPALPTLARQAPPQQRAERDVRASAVMKVLAAFGVLEDRPYEEQQALLEALLQIFYDPI